MTALKYFLSQKSDLESDCQGGDIRSDRMTMRGEGLSCCMQLKTPSIHIVVGGGGWRNIIVVWCNKTFLFPSGQLFANVYYSNQSVVVINNSNTSQLQIKLGTRNIEQERGDRQRERNKYLNVFRCKDHI